MGIVTCPQCGANVSDRLNFCPECHAQVNAVIEKQYCVHCNAETVEHQNFCYSCGRPLAGTRPPINVEPISVEHVLGSSLRIIRNDPVLLLPMLVELVTSIALTHVAAMFFPQLVASLLPSLRGRLLNQITQIFMTVTTGLIIGITLRPIVLGMYPLMVKNTVDQSSVDIREALGRAIKRFPSLLTALTLVGLKVFIGSLLFIIPGIYWLMGYYATIPAVMLEDRGGREGMSASMSFSRHRKWTIFGLLLITSPPAYLGPTILRYFMGNSVPIVATTIFDLTIGLALNVLGVVMCCYAYIRYGMTKS